MEALELDHNTEAALQSTLDALVLDSGARYSSLISSSGILVVESGTPPVWDESGVCGLAALATGAYYASYELHRRFGSGDFSGFLQEGDNLAIYISSVDEDVILLSALDNATTAGLVRLCHRRVEPLLRKDLTNATKVSIAATSNGSPRNKGSVFSRQGLS